MGDFGRTTLHGIPQSVPNAEKLPSVGNHGSECIAEDIFGKWFYDMTAKAWLPREYIVGRWDFDDDGGAVSEIELGIEIPTGVIVLDGIYDVIEGITTVGAAKMAITLEGSGDVLAAAGVGTAGTSGLHAIVPDGSTPSTMIKTTAARELTLDISVADVLSGSLVVFLRCLRSFSA